MQHLGREEEPEQDVVTAPSEATWAGQDSRHLGPTEEVERVETGRLSSPAEAVGRAQ
jgi:hypothetical protein